MCSQDILVRVSIIDMIVKIIGLIFTSILLIYKLGPKISRRFKERMLVKEFFSKIEHLIWYFYELTSWKKDLEQVKNGKGSAFLQNKIRNIEDQHKRYIEQVKNDFERYKEFLDLECIEERFYACKSKVKIDYYGKVYHPKIDDRELLINDQLRSVIRIYLKALLDHWNNKHRVLKIKKVNSFKDLHNYHS